MNKNIVLLETTRQSIIDNMINGYECHMELPSGVVIVRLFPQRKKNKGFYFLTDDDKRKHGKTLSDENLTAIKDFCDSIVNFYDPDDVYLGLDYNDRMELMTGMFKDSGNFKPYKLKT